DPAPRVVLPGDAVHALVTPTPVIAVARLRESGVDAVEAARIPPGWSSDQPFPGSAADGVGTGATARPRVVVGDPDAWLMRGPLLADIRRTGDVVLEGCTARDVRTLLRVRAAPPPLAPVPGRAWRITPEGEIRRCSWPPATPGSPAPPVRQVASAPAAAAVAGPAQPVGISR
ncbi:cell division protein FtsK, partial [Clavibacter michiganensis subsp. insidiosus]